MLELLRKGINIDINEELIPARGSENIPIRVKDDGSYADYYTQVHCGWLTPKKQVDHILAKEDDHWIIPKEAFMYANYIYLSIGLVKDKEIIKTHQKVIRILPAPNGQFILPTDYSWQKIVQDYMAEMMEDIYVDNYKEEFQKDLNRLNNTVKKAEEITDDINEKLANGEFIGPQGPQGRDGEKGEKGDPGESGVVTPTNGFISITMEENGDVYVNYADNDTPPNFGYDQETGNIYYDTE